MRQDPADQGLQYPQHYSHPSHNQILSSTHAAPHHVAHPGPSPYWNTLQPAEGMSPIGYVPQTAHPPVLQHPIPPHVAPVSSGFPPFRLLSESEYATGPYDQSSVEIGLHQVEVRSPRRVPIRPFTTRHYQFIKELAILPCEIEPLITLRAIKFDVSEQAMGRLSRKLGTMPESEGLPFAQYYDKSLRYRLRICLRPEDEEGLKESEWVISATHWPENIFLELNDHLMEVRRKQHFNKDMPLELTDFLRQGENIVRICLPPARGNSTKGYKYIIGVEVVETRSHDSLLTMIKSQRVSADETLQKIQQRLCPSDSDDLIIEDETLSVSIADPFSSAMFEVPIRGADCKHLECFDLETWLQTRPLKPKLNGGKRSIGGEPSLVDVWKCPICSLDARPPSLQIDEFFVQVRKTLLEQNEPGVKSITINANGTWNPVQEPDDVEEDEPGPSNGQANGDRTGTKKPSTSSVIEILDD